MTKRFGLSRNNGSNDGSKTMVGSDLMASNSADFSSFVELFSLPWSASIFRILFGEAPLTGIVAAVLRGLYRTYM